MIHTIQFQRQITNKGYVKINVDFKWVYEHVYVVENFIKRELNNGECIHHIDSNKQNNNINNLMIFKCQADHKSFENKVKQFGFTKPILKQIKNRWNYDRIEKSN